jgi:perosamine synthetase
VGLVQLNRLDEMNRRRREAARRRSELLKDVTRITLPCEPPDADHLYYVYGILVQPDWAGEKRDRLIARMRERYGIYCSVSNPPTYRRWPYIAEHCEANDLPMSEEVGQRLFCPPLHPLLNEEQELYICAALIETLEMVGNE